MMSHRFSDELQKALPDRIYLESVKLYQLPCSSIEILLGGEEEDLRYFRPVKFEALGSWYILDSKHPVHVNINQETVDISSYGRNTTMKIPVGPRSLTVEFHCLRFTEEEDATAKLMQLLMEDQ